MVWSATILSGTLEKRGRLEMGGWQLSPSGSSPGVFDRGSSQQGTVPVEDRFLMLSLAGQTVWRTEEPLRGEHPAGCEFRCRC